MFELNLPPSNLTPYLRRVRSERAETVAEMLRTGIVAIGERIAALAAARARRRLRRQTVRDLRSLPDRTLRDIGLSRSQIWAVADDLVNGATGHRAPPSAPPYRTAVNENRPGRRSAVTCAVAGCG